MAEKANFFDRKAKALPIKEVDLPVFGKVVLEKLDYAKTMLYWELSAAKYEQYSKTPFVPLEDDAGNPVTIKLTRAWCDTCAMLTVVQKMQDWGIDKDGNFIDNRYSFEEFVAASVTEEGEYNQLVIEMNKLNASVIGDPKAQNLKSEASSSEPKE
jgi:hypothetical protein